ncbi:hypothetical protein FD723_40155 (plasmid) [Nostoc sp. C052]|uniref:DUF5662 family protein n=1 Tax=Nostoc sp. C052 TaxID=2576902 RepID=UPI0015C377C8|nr:DUF5662 family protein [Nostoc sp. C052]QLE46427.1 hypothetical protein FD723_40155 [Nostoc sp. C052]
MSNQSPHNLTLAQKANCFDTWQHIFLIQKLLAKMQIELMNRQFTHDQSKMRSPEVEDFTEYGNNMRTLTYGSPEYFANLGKMRDTVAHHYAHNRHHPEFFADGVNGMNLIDLIELICDWYASSLLHDDGNIEKSIEISSKRFNISPEITKILINTLPLITDVFESLHTQADI